MPEQLSAIIITFNEEKNIARCLDAVSQVADEIIVVDSFSTDRTEEICLSYGTKFVKHKFEGYIEQKDYARGLATHDFILTVDADEVLSNELISSIRKVKAKPKQNAYTVNRLSYYVDRFIYHGHWFPDKTVRLFRKNCGHWGGRSPHDKFVPNRHESVRLLDGKVYHYTYESIAEHLAQANKFSEIGAQQLTGRSWPFLAFKAIFSPIWGFFYGYIFRMGFLDGWYGLIIAIITSAETFLKYTKAITKRIKENKTVSSEMDSTDVAISLIVSTYNWPAALEQTLLSISRQVVLPNEVIIADDGSGAETKSLINRFQESFPVPLIHSWIEDKGFRLAKSRNEAIKLARYDYIVQVDGDLYLNKYFVKDHADFARRKTFVRGSRVLLNEAVSKTIFQGKIGTPSGFTKGATNFFNSLRWPMLRDMLDRKSASIAGIRGCNMAYWREDALAVNGYNEEIEGWGREDSEFIARLINYGVLKRNIRLGAVQFHLYHKEYDRALLNKNDNILNQTLNKKQITCKKGIVRFSD